jgi:TPR repeat protein
MLKRTLVGLIVAVVMTSGAVAGQYEDGAAAEKRGDYVTALRLFRALVEKGNANAQDDLGLMYDNGYGVSQDYAEAAKWYQLAAVQGNAEAQNNLGSLYNRGEGVTQDYVKALKWYQLAAAQDNAQAQNNLGSLYANGHGVSQDFVQAEMWFTLAAARGDEEAVTNRDTAANLMAPDQIAMAQRMAREWKPTPPR